MDTYQSELGQYEPSEIEPNLSEYWKKASYFNNQGTCPFIIYLPPPNITGTLHMGHAFNQTIIDIIIRYQKMIGREGILIPGTDHAGIATQLVVQNLLKKRGISLSNINRNEFIKTVLDWKDSSSSTIYQQISRLGTSCNWDKTYFTMDENMSKSVTEAFVRLYQNGLIYRGKKLIHWDCNLMTAVSDLEVKHKEVNSTLWYIKYKFQTNLSSIKTDGVIVATTRPETMFGDTAVCVHPNDERYSNLIGTSVKIPLTNRYIPIIADTFVDKNFGTGCVKITGAHSFDDYSCSKRHNLPIINTFTLSGKLNHHSPTQFNGIDRIKARSLIVKELKENNYIVKSEHKKSIQPYGDRSDALLEPMFTNQWFMAMNKPINNKSDDTIASLAIKAVKSGQVCFLPDQWESVFYNWMNNIQDWCLSRQILWGHRIPAWHSKSSNDIFVARSKDEAMKSARLAGLKEEDLIQDNDVLDTWFSSSLIPFSAFGWPNQSNNSITQSQYLSSDVLVTGFDIIFFWVARMIMMSLYFTNQVPFKKVYIHGLVRDHHGKKMSKSRGNTIDPIDIISGITLKDLVKKRCDGMMNNEVDMQEVVLHTKSEYPNGINGLGADALRFTMASYATMGRDINFDVKRCQGYRNFCNKIWNATRFVLIHTKKYNQESDLSVADKWILSTLQKTISNVKFSFENYRFDQVAELIYHFVWDEFCKWYLEFCKIDFQNSKEKVFNSNIPIGIINTILRLAHPIIPFITETLWQHVSTKKCSLISQNYPLSDSNLIDENSILEISKIKKQVEIIRGLRSEFKLSKKDKIDILVANDGEHFIESHYLISLCGIKDIKIVKAFSEKDFFQVKNIDGIRFMLRF